jgi:hypothetical protein
MLDDKDHNDAATVDGRSPQHHGGAQRPRLEHAEADVRLAVAGERQPSMWSGPLAKELAKASDSRACGIDPLQRSLRQPNLRRLGAPLCSRADAPRAKVRDDAR